MTDVQTLSDTLDAIATDVATVVTEFTALEAELQTLQNNTPPEVDLSGVIAKANSIRASLETIANSAAGPVATPTPTPAPSDTPPADSTPPADTPAPVDTPPADNSGSLGDGSGTLG